MKLLIIFFLFFHFSSSAQPLSTGTYNFRYCDLEYNKCISICKVIIKGSSIRIIATKELSKSLTGITAGEVLEKGTLVKTKTGKWTIKKTGEKITPEDELLYIDFKRREVWRL